MVTTDRFETSVTLRNIAEHPWSHVDSNGSLKSEECWYIKQSEATDRLKPCNVIYLGRGLVISNVAMYSRCSGFRFLPKIWLNWNGIFAAFSSDLSGQCSMVDCSWNVTAHGDAREGKWRGNWRLECVASTLHTTSEHGVSNITTADAHTSAVSSRLNWRPRRFKWTRPSRAKDEIWFLRVCHHVSNAV